MNFNVVVLPLLCSLQELFTNVITHDLVKKGATELSIRLRFLSLKGLASLLATVKDRAEAALGFYRLASIEDDTDVNLWDRYGSLALEQGEWAVARAAFCRVLRLDPEHPTAGDKLVRLLLHVGDFAAAKGFAAAYLRRLPWHELCRTIEDDKIPQLSEKEERIGALSTTWPSTSIAEPTDSALDLVSPTVLQLRRPTWKELINRIASLVNEDAYFAGKVRFRAPSKVGDDKNAASTLPSSIEALHGNGQIREGGSIITRETMELQADDFGNGVETIDDRSTRTATQGRSNDQNPNGMQEDSVTFCSDNVIGGTSGATSKRYGERSDERIGASILKKRMVVNESMQATDDGGMARYTAEGNVRNGVEIVLDYHGAVEKRARVSDLNRFLVGSSAKCKRIPERSLRRYSKVMACGRFSEDSNLEGGGHGALVAAKPVARVLWDVCALKLASKGQPQEVPSNENLAKECGAAIKEYLETSSEQEAAEVSRAVLGRPGGMVTLHLAVGLIQKWAKDRDSAARLRYCGAMRPLLNLALTLQKRNWQGAEISAESCLILAELFVDVATNASNTESDALLDSEAVLSTTSRSRGIALKTVNFLRDDYLSIAGVWLSRYSVAAYNRHVSAGHPSKSTLSLEGKLKVLDDVKYLHQSNQLRHILGFLGMQDRIIADNGAGSPDAVQNEDEDRGLRELAQYVETEMERLRLIRYVWALGRLHEISGRLDHATSSYVQCLYLVDFSQASIALDHCEQDSFICPSAIRDKLVSLKLRRRIEESLQHEEQGDYAHVIEILTSCALSCDRNELLFLRNDRSNWTKALEILNRAASEKNDVGLEFRCHLRFLESDAPSLPEAFLDHIHGTRSDSKSLSINVLEPTESLLSASQTLSKTAEFMSSLGFIDAASRIAIAPFEKRLLQMLIPKTFYTFLSCCYRLGSSAVQTNSQEGSSSRDELRRMACDTAVILLHLWDVARDHHAANGSSASLLQQHLLDSYDLSLWLTEILSANFALLGHEGAFPFSLMYFAKKRISIAKTMLGRETATHDIRAQDIASSAVFSFVSAIRCCVYYLFGLRVSEDDDVEPWGFVNKNDFDVVTAGTSGGCGRLDSRKVVIDMWPYVKEFLGMKSPCQLRALPEVRRFVKRITSLFSMPPIPIVATIESVWDMMQDLETPGVEGSKARRELVDPVQNVLDRLQSIEKDALQSVSKDEVDVYRSIFKLKADVQDSIEEYLAKLEDDLFSDESLQRIATWLEPIRWDLGFNPSRTSDGWLRLASAHMNIMNDMRLQAAREVLVTEWKHESVRRKIISVNEKLSQWCLAMAQRISLDRTVEDRVLLLYGSILYDKLVNMPPEYDQMTIVPTYEEPFMMGVIEEAIALFQKYVDRCPQNYLGYMRMGELLLLKGSSPQVILELLGTSCRLVKEQYEGKLIDPMLALHFARMKLLLKLDHRAKLTTLQVLSRHCFSTAARNSLQNLLASSNMEPSEALENRIEDILREDLKGFMEWCMLELQQFYPNSLNLALEVLYKGDIENFEMKLLKPLFSRHGADGNASNQCAFALHLKPWVGGKCVEHDKAQHLSASCSSAPSHSNTPQNAADKSHVPASSQEPNYLRIEDTFVGISEPKALFVGRFREYMILHMEGLAKTMQWSVMDELCLFLQQDQWCGHGFDDLRLLFNGYYLSSLLDSAMARWPLQRLMPSRAEAKDMAAEKSRNYVSMFTSKSGLLWHLEKLSRQRLDGQSSSDVLERLYKAWSNFAFYLKEESPSTLVGGNLNFEASLRKVLERQKISGRLWGHGDELQYMVSDSRTCRIVLQTYAWLHILTIATSASARDSIEHIRKLLLPFQDRVDFLCTPSLDSPACKGYCTPAARRLLELCCHVIVRLLQHACSPIIASACSVLDKIGVAWSSESYIASVLQISRHGEEGKNQLHHSAVDRSESGSEGAQQSEKQENGTLVIDSAGKRRILDDLIDALAYAHQVIRSLPWLERCQAMTKNLCRSLDDAEDLLRTMYALYALMSGSSILDIKEMTKEEQLTKCEELISTLEQTLSDSHDVWGKTHHDGRKRSAESASQSGDDINHGEDDSSLRQKKPKISASTNEETGFAPIDKV